VENVYKEWKPVDFGHPLRDATMYYAPPSLERVHLVKTLFSFSSSSFLYRLEREARGMVRPQCGPLTIDPELMRDYLILC
jgi:hypothetical protein